MNLKHKRQMKTFDELFENALRYGSIPVPENASQKEAMKSQYNYAFNVWLQEKKGWKHANESQYIKLLTKENWNEFLEDERQKEQLEKVSFESEKEGWGADKSEAENIYLIKDGKQVTSTWEYFNKTGLVDAMKAKYGATINPIHNFKLLKQERLKFYGTAKTNFIQERNLNQLETTDFEYDCFYIAWLKSELKNTEQWLSDKYPNGNKKRMPSVSSQIEILKYKQFVTDEITVAEKRVTQPRQIETKPGTIEIKPVFKPESVDIIFNLLKDYFPLEQQAELKQTITTGNRASKKLFFKDNGNRLTDTFRKLIEHGFITGCDKQTLIGWVISNFTFLHRGAEKAFLYDTVEKTISRNYYPCQSPLIEVKRGQIQTSEQPRNKKHKLL